MRYTNYTRAGYFKTLDQPSVVSRLIYSSHLAISRRISKQGIIFAICLVGFVLGTHYLVGHYYQNIAMTQIDTDDPLTSAYIKYSIHQEEFKKIQQIFLQLGLIEIQSKDVKQKDIQAKSQLLLDCPISIATNKQLEPIWAELTKLLTARDTIAKLNDLVINYRIHTYYTPTPRFDRPTYLTSTIYSNLNIYRQALTVKTEDEIGPYIELITKLSLVKDLVRTDVQTTNEAKSAGAMLQDKYIGLYRHIAQAVHAVLQSEGLSLIQEVEQHVVNLIYMTIVYSLHSTVEKDILSFESTSINTASRVSPVTYTPSTRCTRVIYDYMDAATKTFSTAGLYLSVYGEIESINCVNAVAYYIVQRYLQRPNYNYLLPSRVSRNQGVMASIHNDLLASLYYFAAKPDVTAEELQTPLSVSRLLQKLEPYEKTRSAIEDCVRYAPLLISLFLVITRDLLMGIPTNINIIRSDYGKYFFSYTKHETWLAYMAVYALCVNVVCAGLVYGVISLYYSPYFYVYEHPYILLIKVLRPLIMAFARTCIYNLVKQQALYIAITLTATYLLDEIRYFNFVYILSRLFTLCVLGTDAMYKFVLHTSAHRHCLWSRTGGLAIYNSVTDYLSPLFSSSPITTYIPVVTNMHVQYIPVVQGYSCHAHLAVRLVKYSVFISFMFIVLSSIFYKLDTLPGTPEEYVPMH